MNPVVRALALLTPYDIDKPKIRFGPPADGGYIFVDDISPDQAIISYGISTEYRFDAEMAAKGHDVYMFDHTIGGINVASDRMHFFREGVAGMTDPAASLYTIEDHLARHDIAGDRLILKMDVEGAEFAALSAVPEEVLERFEQIVFEVHGLERVVEDAYRETFCAVFEKLNRLFTLFHVHANNCDGPNGLHIVSGLPVSPIMELSYVRTSTVDPRPSRTVYPTPLDYPNVGTTDKLLWFFPFLPSSVGLDDYTARSESLSGCRRSIPEVFSVRLVNVAIGKPASQSSLSHWSVEGDASRAVSGAMPPAFAFHTDIEDTPWWQVDLVDVYPIETIVLHNRLDSLQERARTLKVEVSEDCEAWVVVHTGLIVFSGGTVGAPFVLPLDSQVRGRYVRVGLTERQPLHLAQVEVFVRAELVEFAKFRTKFGLSKLKLALEDRDEHPFHTYCIEGKTNKDKYGRIIGLKMSFAGRFGNFVQQFTNMFLFAERTGLKYIQLGTHELFCLKAPIRTGDLVLLPAGEPLPRGGAFISGVFYYPMSLNPVLGSRWEASGPEMHWNRQSSVEEQEDECRVVREILRPNVLASLVVCPKDQRELTIHIRSGDVFGEPKDVLPLYRQPPLAFYELVIERLVSAGSIDRVSLVFEDRGNPCVDALEALLHAKDLPYRMQSGTLAEDLSALIDAPHVVFGFGTFGYSVCRLSKRIETIHYFEPEHGGVYADIPGIGHVFAVRDRAGKYIKPGEWHNTPAQRELMLSYPIDALEVEAVVVPLPA